MPGWAGAALPPARMDRIPHARLSCRTCSAIVLAVDCFGFVDGLLRIMLRAVFMSDLARGFPVVQPLRALDPVHNFSPMETPPASELESGNFLYFCQQAHVSTGHTAQCCNLVGGHQRCSGCLIRLGWIGIRHAALRSGVRLRPHARHQTFVWYL